MMPARMPEGNVPRQSPPRSGAFVSRALIQYSTSDAPTSAPPANKVSYADILKRGLTINPAQSSNQHLLDSFSNSHPLHSSDNPPHLAPTSPAMAPPILNFGLEKPLPAALSTYLPYLPEHIIDDIVRDLDERSLWRMMGTCRSLRGPAERALKPYLETLVIRPNPPLITDFFQAIDPAFTKNDKARRDDLHRITQRVESIFDAYPPVKQLARALTNEVRSDDAYASWELLYRLAPQLLRLELHILDSRWSEAGTSDEDDPFDVENAWPSHLFDPPLVLFHNLTSLFLVATARTFAHVTKIARFLPRLRDLTIGAQESDGCVIKMDPYNPISLDHPPEFENLTITGNPGVIAMILFGIISGMPHVRRHVRRLFIHSTCTGNGNYNSITIGAINAAILMCAGIREFALTGPIADETFSALAELGNEEGMPDLTSLALEFVPKMPTLWIRPDCPYLRYLTFMEPLLCPDGDSLIVPRTDMSYFFYRSDLQTVFDDYELLERVQYVAGYPVNPFAQPVEADTSQHYVMCYVDRPAPGEEIVGHWGRSMAQ